VIILVQIIRTSAMKKLNQKGVIEPIQVLLIIMIIGVMGFVGYRITQSKEDEVVPVATQQVEEVAEEVKAQPEEDIIKAVDPAVELFTVEDISKLPDYTPASFVEYMTGELEKNVADENGCIMVYGVNKVSPLNIGGGTGAVSATTLGEEGNCSGGASTVWYLKDGKWSYLGFQSIPNCDEIASTTIYKEFSIANCYDTTTENALTPNPNGSIYDAL